MESSDQFVLVLPENYTYCDIELQVHSETDFEASFHANINDLSEGDKWVREYEKLTKTDWKVKHTYARYVCTLRKDYICRHGYMRCVNRARNTKCQAKMIIKIIPSTRHTRNRNKWVREGMRATVTITNRHNHDIKSAHALSARKIDSHTRDLFMEYFNNGFSVPEAIQHHINQLDLDPNIENHVIARADAAINPSRRTVYYLHDIWRKANLGSHHGEGMWSVLEKKIQEYTAAGANVSIDKDRNVIVVVTALMRRAHILSTSSEIAFVDSTTSCDAENHTITFLMLTSSHGAVPGGVIITSGQSEADYVSGFSALKDALGDVAFGGKGSPQVFMTDDSSAERNALKAVWPSTELKLCNFHILQAVWRWLWDANHCIEKNQRKAMMHFFQSLLYSPTIEVANDNYQKLMTSVPYHNFAAYVEQLWSRKEDWCHAWHNIPAMRGHHTNNYSEINVRLFKDLVLTRCKAYNAVSLVDFVIVLVDQFYRHRLDTFANGRINAQHILFEYLLKKASYIQESQKAKVQRELNSNIYLVPSECTVDKVYEVDPSIGCCTCADGMSGTICKHQMVVYKLLEENCPNLPAVSAMARYECAVLALGPEAQPLPFYERPNDNIHSSGVPMRCTTENLSQTIKKEPAPAAPNRHDNARIQTAGQWKAC